MVSNGDNSKEEIDKILKVSMNKAAESRKNATRATWLIFGALIIIAFAVGWGLVNHFKLRESKTELFNKNKDLIGVRDSLQKAVKVKDSLKNELINLIELNSKPTTTANVMTLTPIQKAKYYAERGYNMIARKQLDSARLEFKKSENSFNGYRFSYEIYRYLNNNKDKFKDSASQMEIFNEIRTKYDSWDILKNAVN